MSDNISRQAAIDKFIDGLSEIFADIREEHVDDSVCGLCEYDGAYLGQSGDWCNECPGFDKDDCFKLSDKIRKKWADEIIKALPSTDRTGHWMSFEQVADMLSGMFGKCACDVNGNDEWLSFVCKYADTECPNPKEENGCWMQFLLQGGADMRGVGDGR